MLISIFYMWLSQKEIECFLYLYPFAKKHYIEKSFMFMNSTYFLEKQNSQNQFYLYIIDKVNHWLEIMDKSEIELIKLRYFQNYSLCQIAYKVNYSNHSAVIKRIHHILKKIEKETTQYE